MKIPYYESRVFKNQSLKVFLGRFFPIFLSLTLAP